MLRSDSPGWIPRKRVRYLPGSFVRRLIEALLLCLLACSCEKDTEHTVVISVPDQRMAVFKKGVLIAQYSVSTSKFGVGSRPGSYATPLGRLEIARKIGGAAPSGAVFKSRQPTGEVLAPDAPGRDPIVTRILWLRGLDVSNCNAYDRCIYIHGTPEERNIGIPSSYGCIRMRSCDVIELYDTLGVGAAVEITTGPLLPPAPGSPVAVAHDAPQVKRPLPVLIGG